MMRTMYSMKTKAVFALTTALCIAGACQLCAQPMTGTYTVGPGGSYATLTAAIAALSSAGVGTGGVTFEINNTYVSTGETFPIVLPPITGASAANPIRIWRANDGTSTRVISQGGAVPTIRVTGSYYTFD
ncbi:MAG: hypothetical protein NZ534_11540, partial [Bacteroidia bacterium]|nr:hypothetical protein [Bacteroidia bacterium]